MEYKKIAFSMWGKLNPYKPLIRHMIDAGVCAEKYLIYGNKSLIKTIEEKTNMSREEILRLVGYFVACHDIGKVHPWFQLRSDLQENIPNEIKNIINPQKKNEIIHPNFRHEIYSVSVLKRIWSKKNYNKNMIEEITSVIADHHQKRGKIEHIPQNEKELYETIQDILETELNDLFQPKISDFECDDWSVFCETLNGILVLSDWIASNSLFMKEEIHVSNEEYYEKAREEAEHVVKSIGFRKCETPYSDNLYEMYGWNKETMRPMQCLVNQFAREKKSRFVIIEDSPGAGKTEAAVYLALWMAKKYEKSGLYFGLPTSATANQMWNRLNGIFSKYNISDFRLVHGMAWALVENDETNIGSEDVIGEEWLRPSRKALLSQYAVGTVDQIMMAVMNLKFRQLRMLGLTDKVIIIDEVHAYDAYMSTILDRLLEWCGSLNIPVILLSATLPKKKKQDYISAYSGRTCEINNQHYPLLSACDENKILVEETCDSGKRGNYILQTLDILNDLNQTVEKAISLVKDGGNLCLMLNTVTDAQKTYKYLKERINEEDGIKLLLYHARFKAKDRMRIESECLKRYSKTGERPFKSILVCTQVVEQSLDVDFDILMTQICPVDLLIQRMGREWRHNINRPKHIKSPVVYVLVGDVLKSPMKSVYSTYIIRKTIEFIKNEGKIKIPEDLRKAVSFVYDNEDGSLDYFEDYFENEIKNRTAEGVEISSPDPDEYFLAEQDPFINEDDSDTISVATRLGRKSTRVVLCTEKLKDSYKQERGNRDLQNQMLENSISISEDIPFEKCEQNGVLKGIFVATEENGRYVISENVRIIYSEEIGAVIERSN